MTELDVRVVAGDGGSATVHWDSAVDTEVLVEAGLIEAIVRRRARAARTGPPPAGGVAAGQ